MRQRQPLGQELRGLCRCVAVERHHCRREAWGTGQLRAPPIADWSDFDLVRAPADGFVEAMKYHVFDVRRKRSGMQFYAADFSDQAKRIAKTDAQAAFGLFPSHPE